MAAPCSGDPLICIELVVLFLGKFLKDWTTLAMLALLLGLLLQWRADRRKATEAAYARRIKAYDEKRSEEDARAPSWEVTDNRNVGRQTFTPPDSP